MTRQTILRTSIICTAAALIGVVAASEPSEKEKAHEIKGGHFEASDRCIACHNNIISPAGEDISIGFSWRPSIMANSSRDPYWQAGVRHEVIDHPVAKAAIEDECSICHMPMARYEAKLQGQEGQIFAHLPFDPSKLGDKLAEDGVSCSVCHQIENKNLGTRESFVGRFLVDPERPLGERPVYGPFDVDKGRTTVMRSSSGFKPTEADHIRQSELCATCHTLLTKALGPKGEVIGELPEQVPYQEWLHSDYRENRSCQSCHMPLVPGEVPITGILGQKRKEVRRHVFVGGNFFMQRILNRYRGDLAVAALPQELDAAIARTISFLQTESAHIAISNVAAEGGRLRAEVAIENISGHKLPTAYPSRRAWIHFVVKDRNHRTVFESGALNPNGSIEGNDNDADAKRVEPHYNEINSADQVQIYESVMQDASGSPTTGLLSALRFMKDNRLLPHGFDKKTAEKDIAVIGEAANDEDFTGGEDHVRYSVALGDAQGPFEIEAELWYQPISYRWANNLRPYNAPEPQRFVRYYEEMAPVSAVVLAHASSTK